MGTIKVEERGRILIPKEIRDKLGLKPGSELEIILEEGKIKILPKMILSEISTELKGCVKESNIDPLKVKEIWKM
ncbi:MAG: AbrB/MazE/SpoVT family DNA-binding domain-containing protein [Candidatus Kariarchaeaceae archaeon]|jgi:AbrB family looped-hinge helix DNA binding protein